MSTLRSYVLALLTPLLCGQLAIAQVVEVRRLDRFGNFISSTQHPANTPISINAFGFPDGQWLHIYNTGDPNNPANGIGAVTMTGVPNGALNIVVAGAAQSIPIDSGIVGLEEACFNFGGLQYAQGIFPGQVRFFGRVSGSTTGAITCGTVERVEANFDIGGIHATVGMPYTNTVTQRQAFLAINRVLAGRAITGEIRADSGDIFLVAVRGAGLTDGNPLNDGILADILAPEGQITQIYTMGQIGSESGSTITRRNIVAKQGLTFLRAVDVASVTNVDTAPAGGTALNVPFRAVISTGDASTVGLGDEQKPRDRATWKLETQGDFDGDITLQNLTASRYLSQAGSSRDWGIRIGGSMKGRVTIRDGVLIANIRAAHFEQPIEIGTLLKGGIIARTGSVPSISVGFSPLPSAQQNGFVGSICSPGLDPDDPTTGVTCDGSFSEADSVIRVAGSIGELRISSMNMGMSKQFWPRIEAPAIGSLTIGVDASGSQVGFMRNGVVWSGLLETGPSGNDPTNDYSSIGTINISCISNDCELFVKDFTTFEIRRDLSGRVFMPRIETSATLRVGESMTISGDCAPEIASRNFTLAPNVLEVSPRRGAASGINRITIAEPLGLRGQIIINADNTQTTSPWSGEVVMPVPDPLTGLNVERTFVTTAAPPFRAPHYAISSALLGGGAIGEVPFHIYEADCVPPHRVRLTDPPTLSETENFVPPSAFESGQTCNAAVPVKLRFYGPVALNPENPFVIRASPPAGNLVCGQPFTDILQSIFLVRPPGSHPEVDARTIGFSRSLACSTIGDGKFAIGEFEFNPDFTTVLSVPRESSTGVPAIFFDVCETGVEDRTFYFRVSSAVNNCIDPGNFDGMNGINVADIFDFLNAWFASLPSADIDGSGTVAVADIFAFLNEWFDGCA
ncbi:MAG: ATP-binding protein [Phycisphaerales bacterium]|nr:ATP-binding protein [Phycisphaerales bacterium]